MVFRGNMFRHRMYEMATIHTTLHIHQKLVNFQIAFLVFLLGTVSMISYPDSDYLQEEVQGG